jgi:hypothetical protein
MNENQTYTFCSTEINHSSINLAANKLSRTLIRFDCGKNEEVFLTQKTKQKRETTFLFFCLSIE